MSMALQFHWSTLWFILNRIKLIIEKKDISERIQGVKSNNSAKPLKHFNQTGVIKQLITTDLLPLLYHIILLLS